MLPLFVYILFTAFAAIRFVCNALFLWDFLNRRTTLFTVSREGE